MQVLETDALVIALISPAFLGEGFGSLGWIIVADTAPRKMIGLTGSVFNAIRNMTGITTPVVISYILGATGSFHGVLMLVGLHGLVAAASYWLIVGRIERYEIRPRETAPAVMARLKR